MAKSGVKDVIPVGSPTSTGASTLGELLAQEQETPEVYTGNVYEFQGGIHVSNNSGPVTITVNMQGVPNNPPPTGGGSNG